jgi:hypothetical protein
MTIIHGSKDKMINDNDNQETGLYVRECDKEDCKKTAEYYLFPIGEESSGHAIKSMAFCENHYYERKKEREALRME